MPVTIPSSGAGPRPGTRDRILTAGILSARLLIACLILACSDRKSPDPEPVPPAPQAAVPVPPPAQAVDEPEAVDTAAEPPGPAEKPSFRSRPAAKAWPGRPFRYKPVVAPVRSYRLRVTRGPESMRAEKGAVSWTPAAPGRFEVTLEAAWIGESGDTGTAKQSFALEVGPVLSLSMKPLPPRADKGDTLVFDLSGTTFPAWAAEAIAFRFDYDGDGTWDSPPIPAKSGLLHRHAYTRSGRYAPRVEARYLDFETRTVSGAVDVVSAVDAKLTLSPDTAAPGGRLTVDASASKGDGRLAYFLDLNGDGKADWADSATGRAVLKAPGSGRYLAALRVRNPMGEEGKASAPLVVNAPTTVNLRIRNPKENMAAPVEALVEAIDRDDSIKAVRVNFTGAGDAWASATAPDTSKGPGRWRKLFRHAFGKTGRFTVQGCALASDGREVCRSMPVEIFNAPPTCDAGGRFKATLGMPAELEGTGNDPDGSIVKWEWDLDGDGNFDVASAKDGKVKYTFARKGEFTMTLRVTTADGMTATGSRKVEVRKSW